MSGRRRGWRGRRLEDLEPELFWPALVLFWLLAGLNLWRYARGGSVWDLGLGAFTLVMGLRALWILPRRRARREP